MSDWKMDEWTGCYPSNWKGLIVAEAMAHPAKFSSRLIRKIYAHLQDEGWVRAGDCVLDPFGGVALGGLEAARRGLNWYGVELEEKFWKLGNENIELWERKFGALLKGSVHLAHGDSRKLREVLGLERWVTTIGSPPFLVSSGGAHVPSKYADDPTFLARHAAGNKGSNAYGESEGQLSSMREGGFELAISSPPFGQATEGTPLDPEKYLTLRGVLKENAGSLQKISDTPGQLGNMKVAVSSPPYAEKSGGKGRTAGREAIATGYGSALGQLGGADDFWMAARQIVDEVYAGLVPGGHAVWVVKDYVKNKERVSFCDQWRQLCEAAGFVTVHEHHALLVRNKRVQHTLDGSSVTMQSESKSFFRRLAEKNGSPRIDWETVYCMEPTGVEYETL